MKILISTASFAEKDYSPLKKLEDLGLDFTLNKTGRKLKESELIELIPEYDILIAGTEQINLRILEAAKNLKMICRLGVGIDNLDKTQLKEKGIILSYTPDAPSDSVAEYTIALMLSMIRNINISNLRLHNNEWHRIMGKQLAECSLGVVGYGRIGRKVIDKASKLGCNNFLVYDTYQNIKTVNNVTSVSLENLLGKSDIISLHVPLNNQTNSMITKDKLFSMKKDAMLINTSRGDIINEDDLLEVLKSGHLAGVALDVYKSEPYQGSLSNFERCLLTAHMAPMSVNSRKKMEIESVDEVISFIKEEKINNRII